MKTLNTILSAAVMTGLMLSTAVSAQTVTRTGANGANSTKSATHTPGSTSGTVSKTGPNGATASKNFSHTAGQGGTFNSTKTGVNGTTKNRSGSSTVTPAPTTTTP